MNDLALIAAGMLITSAIGLFMTALFWMVIRAAFGPKRRR